MLKEATSQAKQGGGGGGGSHEDGLWLGLVSLEDGLWLGVALDRAGLSG